MPHLKLVASMTYPNNDVISKPEQIPRVHIQQRNYNKWHRTLLFDHPYWYSIVLPSLLILFQWVVNVMVNFCPHALNYCVIQQKEVLAICFVCAHVCASCVCVPQLIVVTGHREEYLELHITFIGVLECTRWGKNHVHDESILGPTVRIYPQQIYIAKNNKHLMHMHEEDGDIRWKGKKAIGETIGHT